MDKKLCSIIAFLVLVALSFESVAAQAEVSVGVKKGDWIEYNVTTTGNPPIPQHNVTWARLEIVDVQGNEIMINSTSRARNGTVSSLILTLNIEKGEIGAWWIIPANLSPGETFYDASMQQNVTIQGEQSLQYAGATRAITNASIPTRTKRWDKATGVFVQSDDDFPDFTIFVEAFSTNMWNPQILGLDSTVFYTIITIIIVIIAIVAVVLLFALRRRKKQNETPT